MSVVGHQPPPFFRRGLPPVAQLTLYLVASLALLVGDLHMRYLDQLRQGVAILAYPLQIAAATPGEFLHNASNYFTGLVGLQKENDQLRAQQLNDAKELLRVSQLDEENAQLRGLLTMRARVPVASTAAEVLFAERDPFSLRVILDKGTKAGIEAGQAVIDQKGLIGQVTRVYPTYAEVTLLTDKNQAIPIVVERSGLRAVMFGTGGGMMELRYLAANADVRAGDRILTSGLDGVFVPGIPVATVVGTKSGGGDAFAHIMCRPVGGVEKAGAVLVLNRSDGKSMPAMPLDADAQSDAIVRPRDPVGASTPLAQPAQSAPAARAPRAAAPRASATRSSASAPAARPPVRRPATSSSTSASAAHSVQP